MENSLEGILSGSDKTDVLTSTQENKTPPSRDHIRQLETVDTYQNNKEVNQHIRKIKIGIVYAVAIAVIIILIAIVLEAIYLSFLYIRNDKMTFEMIGSLLITGTSYAATALIGFLTGKFKESIQDKPS